MIKIIGGIEAESLKQLSKILPDNKTRPSILQPFCHGLALVGAFVTPFLGEEQSFKFIKSMEDAVQEEHDSMLRKMNIHKIDDKTTRKLLVKSRDAGYDFFEKNFPDLKDNKYDTEMDKTLEKATKYFTKGLIRLSRHV